MGLLDSLLYNSDAYGGQGGGLLDFLRATQMQNSQYQPSAGFPDSQPSSLDNAQWPAGPVGAPSAPASFASRFNALPNAPQPFAPSGRQFDNAQFDNAQFDPSTYAPNQAGPIAVGSNYQMPRIGSADQFASSAETTPPNAQPTQGTLPDAAQAVPQAPQQQNQPLPPAFGQQSGSFGGNALTGLQSFLNGSGLITSIRGAMNGQRTDPQALQQQNLKAQYEALVPILVQSGKTPQQASSLAMLAVLNPKAAETLLPEALSNKEQFKTIKDGFGGEHPAFVNTVDQTINGKTIDEYNKQGSAQGGQETFDAIAKARDSGATPAQLYQLAPPQLRDGVQAMIEGRGIPTNLSARGDARNQAIMLAHTIDPTFDESQIPSRVQGNKDFYGGGKSAETMRKTNQSALHFGELVDKMQTLPGSPMPAANAAANFVNSQLLGKGNAGNFVVNGHALADELSTMFKGAGISDTEIRAWESNLSPNMSTEQQRGMSKTLLGLYRDSVSALEKKRIESIGPVVAAQKGPILGPEAEAALQKVEKFAGGQSTPATTPSSNKPATVIQNGHTYTLQPDGSYK